MNAAKTVTANYQLQYAVTFSATGLDTDASGTVVTVGTSDYIAAGSLPAVRWIDNNGSIAYTYSDPVGSSTPGKQYNKTSGADAGESDHEHHLGSVRNRRLRRPLPDDGDEPERLTEVAEYTVAVQRHRDAFGDGQCREHEQRPAQRHGHIQAQRQACYPRPYGDRQW